MRLTNKHIILQSVNLIDTEEEHRKHKQDDLRYRKLWELENLEEELCLPLKVWAYLIKKFFMTDERIYIENIFDNEKERKVIKEINGREQRFILDIDFDNKYIDIQGFEDWTKQPFKNYGKTWTLPKEDFEQ